MLHVSVHHSERLKRKRHARVPSPTHFSLSYRTYASSYPRAVVAKCSTSPRPLRVASVVSAVVRFGHRIGSRPFPVVTHAEVLTVVVVAEWHMAYVHTYHAAYADGAGSRVAPPPGPLLPVIL